MVFLYVEKLVEFGRILHVLSAAPVNRTKSWDLLPPIFSEITRYKLGDSEKVNKRFQTFEGAGITEGI